MDYRALAKALQAATPSCWKPGATTPAVAEGEEEASLLTLIERTQTHLTEQSQAALKQAQTTFLGARLGLTLGFILVLGGMVVEVTPWLGPLIGVVILLVAAIALIVGAVALGATKSSQEQVRTLREELSRVERTEIALRSIRWLADPRRKEQALSDLTAQLSAWTGNQGGRQQS